MKRLFFGQFLVLATFSSLVHAEAGDIHSLLQKNIDKLTPANCVSSLTAVSKTLDELKAEDYLSEFTQVDRLRDELWEDKIKLHEKLRSIHAESILQKDCGNAIRGVLRVVRTIEDYAQERQLRVNPTGVVFPDRAFTEGNVHVKRHPRYANFNMMKDYKSGDIILSRGSAYTSAVISQLGEFDTGFSHMSFVHVDDKGEIWTIEAHIEVGSFVRPLQDHIDDGNRRIVVYRFHDEAIAKKASDLMFEKVRKASNSRRGNIRYDFSFSMEEKNEYFCSEVVSQAFDIASEGAVKLPYIKSRLMTRKQKIMGQLEITADESFVPADIEIDPRFEMIAEWRDANRIVDTFEKDYLIQSMMVWSNDLGYELKQASSMSSLMYRNIAWPMRRLPLLNRYFKDKMPINMSRSMIGYFGVIDTLGKLLQAQLTAADKEMIESRGLPLLPAEARAVMEEYRLKDLRLKKKKMHKMYRPHGKHKVTSGN